MTSAQKLRIALDSINLIIAPGAFDCLSAKAVEIAGFSALYMTGMGTSASRLGLPDYGLATMTEMVANAHAISAAVQIPVIADADTGYGNELNMTRTVHEYERSGAAGVHIEDQVFPKKCGHLGGKQVIARDEYISKIAAAVAARRDPNFVIIARTDANAVLGFDEAIARANAALDVGADLALVEAPETLEQMAAVPELVHGPCVLNVLIGGKSPLATLAQVEQMGYRMTLLSDAMLGAAVHAYDAMMETVKRTTETLRFEQHFTPRYLFERLGSERWDALRPEAQTVETVSQ